MSWPNICNRHNWTGNGKCPSCEGERVANEILAEVFRSDDRDKKPSVGGESKQTPPITGE